MNTSDQDTGQPARVETQAGRSPHLRLLRPPTCVSSIHGERHKDSVTAVALGAQSIRQMTL